MYRNTYCSQLLWQSDSSFMFLSILTPRQVLVSSVHEPSQTGLRQASTGQVFFLSCLAVHHLSWYFHLPLSVYLPCLYSSPSCLPFSVPPASLLLPAPLQHFYLSHPHLLSSMSPYAFSFSWELSIEMSCLCVCLSIFLSYCVWAKRPSPPCWQPLSLWLYFGHGPLTETLEGLSGKRHWGETERALKRLWIPVRSPVLTGSSSLLACSQRLRWMWGIVGMDGSQLEQQLWAATLAKKHQQGINPVMKELER